MQVHEIAATVGMAVLVLSFLPQLNPATLDAAFKPWRPLFLFIGWALLAPTIAGQLPDATGVFRILDWATIPLVAATATELDERRWKLLTFASLGTLALSSAVAGLQHFGLWPSMEFFEQLSWMRLPFHRVYEPIGDSGRFMGGGLIFHRLKFAHVSGLVIVAALVAARHLTGLARTVAYALTAFGFIAVWVFPYARMGAVAMTLAAGLTLVLVSSSPRRALLVSGALGLVGLAAVLAIAPLRERFASALTDQGSGQRTQHLQAGLTAISQHPIVGVGPGQFRPSKFGDASMAEHVKDNPGKAHNQFVSMAAETGIPGGVGFVLVLGWLAAQARRRKDGALVLGALGFFVVLSLVHDPLFQAPVSMALVLAIGLGLRDGKERA